MFGETITKQLNENGEVESISISFPEYRPIYAMDARGRYIDLNSLPPSPKKSKRAYRRMMKRMERENRKWEGLDWG